MQPNKEYSDSRPIHQMRNKTNRSRYGKYNSITSFYSFLIHLGWWLQQGTQWQPKWYLNNFLHNEMLTSLCREKLMILIKPCVPVIKRRHEQIFHYRNRSYHIKIKTCKCHWIKPWQTLLSIRHEFLTISLFHLT